MHEYGGCPGIVDDHVPVTYPVAPAIILSPEQQGILERVKRGENVFFTGSAGTGKSVLLKEIIRHFCPPCFSGELAITASTGIAAINIGGQTLHSWAGIKFGQEPAVALYNKLSEEAALRWQLTQTLIIDEVSMIDGVLFDKLDYVARHVKDSDEPFGGIQLVLSGDFCQLPPVPDRTDGKILPVTFVFESKAWSQCMGPPVTLTHVFRQKDKEFVDILNAMRFGRLTEEATHKLRQLDRPVTYDDGIGPTELYPIRAQVDESNTDHLEQITEGHWCSHSFDYPGYNYKGHRISMRQMNNLLDRLVALREVTLKVGAQVMLIKNLVKGSLVNGSMGKVTGFCTYDDAVKDKRDLGTATKGKPGSVWPEPKYLPAPIRHAIRGPQAWPVVQFTGGREVICIPVEFTVNNGKGGVEACRIQVPLILAWALSVHKSQGTTLERVKVDLRNTFETGQAYVALSRATSMDNLEVLNFDPEKVQVHPRVLQWYDDLECSESHEDDSDGNGDEDGDAECEMDDIEYAPSPDEYDRYNEIDWVGADDATLSEYDEMAADEGAEWTDHNQSRPDEP